MKVSDVNACSFEQWYPLFSKVTIESEILPIPSEVLSYLRSDASLILPKECDEEDLSLQAQGTGFINYFL